MKNKSVYLIIPNCTDLNRGDQALVWQSVSLSKELGFQGDYYVMSDSKDKSFQTLEKGLKIFFPILKHPSRFFKKNDNIQYNTLLKIKWGLIAIFDFFFSITLLIKPLRFLVSKFLTKDLKNSLNLFEQSEKIFVKGGGFLHNDKKGIISFYYMYYMLYHIMLATSLKKEVIVYPNSFGPFNGYFTKKLASTVLGKCKKIYSRESISRNILEKELKIQSELFPDLGFFLEKDNSFNSLEYIKKNNIPIRSKKCVAITVRPYRFQKSKEPKILYEKYISCIIKFSEYLNKNNFHPVFIEHTLAENEHENDSTAINQIIQKLPNSTYSYIKDDNLNCEQIKAIYSNFYFIVGTRFHSVIFSLSEYVPAIAIAYGGNKAKGIMKDMNLSDYCLDIYQLNYKELVNSFQKAIKNRNEYINRIDEYMKFAHKKRKMIKGGF